MASNALNIARRLLPRIIRALKRTFIGTVMVLMLSSGARAVISPWIAADLYDPGKWDTAGPQTATPWLHPPTWTPGQEWGVLSGRIKDSTAITGSWGGTRDELVRKGVAFAGGYLGQPAANPTGGERQDASWLQNMSFAAFLDLQRLMDWKGGFFTTSVDWKSGNELGLSPDHIGNEFPVQLSTGENAFRLVHLALAQELFNNNAELAGGRIITGQDFATIRLACTSLNQAICSNPIAANQNISFPTYPNAVWGARLKVKPGSSWYGLTGAYLVYPDFRDADDHGVNFGAPADSGVLVLGEFGYIVGQYRGEPGLPGMYKIGGYYDREELLDLKTSRPERGTWGIYCLAEQMLYAEDDTYDQGLSAWLALSYAPPDLNEIQFMAAGGLSYKGPFSSRPDDALSFIGAYGRYSSDLRDSQRARGEPRQSGEGLLELNYRAQITPWLFFQPDVQYIINPRGRSDIDNAFVIGFALGSVF